MGKEIRDRLLPTPFVSSFIGRARPGSLDSPGHEDRAAAWAAWAVDSLQQMNGLTDRSYIALVLPGQFYDPKGTGPKVRPHLEIPSRRMEANDPEFPDRLAVIGSTLSFAWWVVAEVTAVKRALFNTPRGSIKQAIEVLDSQRPALLESVRSLHRTLAPHWGRVEELMQTDPERMAAIASADVSPAELNRFFPMPKAKITGVVFDEKLRADSKSWVARRVGVWQITGDGFSFAVLTPRLTANSLFRDPALAPEKDSAAALLVRGLVLSRVANVLTGSPSAQVAVIEPEQKRNSHLRAVPARAGSKLPEASVAAAVRFLTDFPDAENAWAELSAWSNTGYALTVTKAAFIKAHISAARHVRRAEEPDRDDVNILLPLAWADVSGGGKVVRATYSRNIGDDADKN